MVSITEDILKAAQISETELRQEIAMLLYQKGLPLMRAAQFAQMDRFSFQHLLASKQIPIQYDIDDFKHDVETLKSLP